MYERAYGYQYEQQKGLSTVEIAKLIRSDIKTAVKEGLLPADWKYSVRSEYFAGGSSINIRVKNCPDAWIECDGRNGARVGASFCGNPWCKGYITICDDTERMPYATVHYVLSELGQAAQMTLERIHGAYNHDGSDVMTDYFDVNYYGSVDFGDRPC